MRAIRALAIVSAFAVVLPSFASAQSGRGFTDSWFWGVKGGGFTLADSGQKYIQAPLAGIDWMITRTNGGLYVSLGQAFFSQHSFTLRDPASADSGLRPIALKNLRKLDLALVGFPGEHLKYHPYAGIGFTFSAIGTAQAEGPFFSEDQFVFANTIIDKERTAFSPLLLAGLQARLTRFSVFGQVTASPANKSFILYNGKSVNVGYELGLRYNFGSSIDR